jgi:D-alanine-D-alanine ligase
VDDLKQLRVGVIVGGVSREAGVSRISGDGVANALKNTFYTVKTFELTSDIIADLRKEEIDVVFPILHGPPGEDGTIQGALDIAGIPYVGSGVLSSACAMNKPISKHIYRSIGLPVAKDCVLIKNEASVAEQAKKIEKEVGSDVVLKPSDQGSSFGITFSHEFPTMEAALKKAYEIDDRLIVEERIIGMEITCGVLDIEKATALETIEVTIANDAKYDFEHKYTEGKSSHIMPARIPSELNDKIKQTAVDAHKALGCRDLSRSDFIARKDGSFVILETNTLPGMTPVSLYPDQAKHCGISFEDLVSRLVKHAFNRHKPLLPAGETVSS